MADSKFFDAAVKEGMGLREFLERKFPGENWFAEIKPKDVEPYKGFFPAGVIARVFGKEFKEWKKRVCYKSKAGMSFLDILMRRMNKQGKKSERVLK
jgi:hypothetical protein